jgi:FdhD protein
MTTIAPGGATRSTTVQVVAGDRISEHEDRLAVEEPLEIRVLTDVDGQRKERAVSVTMRTPGGGGSGGKEDEDAELAVGYLYTEGLLAVPQQVAAVHKPEPRVVVVELAQGVRIELGSVERHSLTTSACGVCGKSSLAAIRTRPREPLRPGPQVPLALLHGLPDQLRAVQETFRRTGGLHAAGLFDAQGALRTVREDVGRHNAVDKLLGAELLQGRLPAHGALLCVSGRASFELVQKACMASIPVFVAVGAPSTLAVELAAECGMTLVGFARDQRFNIYAHPERLVATAPPTFLHIRKAKDRP